jgi:hypothetical protein
MSKRKYGLIKIDELLGIDENGEPIIGHREIKGNAIKKSKTCGIQEMVNLSLKSEFSIATLYPPPLEKKKVAKK